MVGLFPSSEAISQAFCPTSPYYKPSAKPTEHPQKRPIFSSWSAADTAKDLGKAAQNEYSRMSEKAQAKAGGIELYSAKYYAACTVGGILACVRLLLAPVAFFSN